MSLDPNTNEDLIEKSPKKSSEPTFSISTVMTIIAAVASVLGAWYLLSTRVAVSENNIQSLNATIIELKKTHQTEMTQLEQKHDREVKDLNTVIRELEIKNAELSGKLR